MTNAHFFAAIKINTICLTVRAAVGYPQSVSIWNPSVALNATQTTSTSSTSASTTSVQSTTSSGHSSGLSTGGKAGVGIGTAVGVVSAIALGFFLWRKRQLGGVKEASTGCGNQSPQMTTGSYPQFHNELEPQDRQDLPAYSKPIELAPRRHVTHELPS